MSRKRTLISITIVAGCLLAALAAYRCGPRELPIVGQGAQQWRQQRELMLADPDLERFYTFHDRDVTNHIYRNVAGWRRSFSLPGDRPDPDLISPVQHVSGRWPWKQAVRLDQVPLEADPVRFSGKAFTIETWLRHNGEGMVPGGNYATGGTLLAQGDGVWSGWKLAFYYPCHLLTFELGRPKPDPPVGLVAHTVIPPSVWTHIVATWDGAFLNLYLNGLLSARTPWSGDLNPVPAHGRLRAGHVGNGLGSVRFDLDELAIYSRCLSATDVLTHFCLSASPAAESIAVHQLRGDLEDAGRALTDGRISQALAAYRKLRQAVSAESSLADILQHRIHECLAMLQEDDLALVGFTQIAQRSTSETLSLTAQFQALCLTSDAQAFSSRVDAQAGVPGVVNPHQLCQYSREYATALEAFHLHKAEHDVAAWRARFETQIQPVLQHHCTACHHSENASGGLDLARFTDGHAAGEAGEVWRTVAQRLRHHEMPPPEAAPMPARDREILQDWVQSRPGYAFCEELATDENQRFYPGHVFSRRLTRYEYTNAVFELTGVALTAEQQPPQDGAGGEGFDTVGDILFSSPVHLEAWLRAAQYAVHRLVAQEVAIGDPRERRVLIAEPPAEAVVGGPEEWQAASTILTRFARRAWRRPMIDSERERLLQLFVDARHRGQEFTSAIREPLKAVMVSPHFLFVVETEPPGGGVQRLSAHQLATRLALFLWSSLPDERLLQAADDQTLLQSEVLQAHMQRMFSDPQSSALGEAFGLQWLGLQQNDQQTPDLDVFPEYSPALAADMRQEAARLIAHLFQQNRPLSDLLDADYVIVNDRLARLYGIPEPAADSWQPVSLTDQRRGGVLTMAGVLTANSYPRRTSPVLRGKWILDTLLGSYVSPPPPDIPALDESQSRATPQTLRQQLEQHRQQADCATCHQTMDPLGFALENYNGIGQWREQEHGQPIDANGTLPSGQAVAGPSGLKAALTARRDEFLEHFVRKLLGFAVGRSLNRFDECTVRRSLEQLKQQNLSAQTLIQQIINSHAFQYRYHKASKP